MTKAPAISVTVNGLPRTERMKRFGVKSLILVNPARITVRGRNFRVPYAIAEWLTKK